MLRVASRRTATCLAEPARKRFFSWQNVPRSLSAGTEAADGYRTAFPSTYLRADVELDSDFRRQCAPRFSRLAIVATRGFNSLAQSEEYNDQGATLADNHNAEGRAKYDSSNHPGGSHSKVKEMLRQTQQLIEDADSVDFSTWTNRLFRVMPTCRKLREDLIAIQKQGNKSSLLEDTIFSIDTLLCAMFDQYESDGSHQVDSDRDLVGFVASGISMWSLLAEIPKHREAPNRAEYLLARLDEASGRENARRSGTARQLKPPTQRMIDVYEGLVHCWSGASEHDAKAPSRALAWMKVILAHPNMSVNPRVLNSVLRAFAVRRDIHGLLALFENKSFDRRRNGYSYTIVIKALLEAGRHKKAYHIFQNATKYVLENPNEAEVLSSIFCIYLEKSADDFSICRNVFAKLEHLQAKKPDLPILCGEKIIDMMMAVRQADRPEMTLNLFDLVIQQHNMGRQGFLPSYQNFTLLLKSIVSKRPGDNLLQAISMVKKYMPMLYLGNKDSCGEPISNHAYNIIIDAITRLPKNKNRWREIQSWLTEMNKMADESGNSKLRPDKATYKSLIFAMSFDYRPISDVVKLLGFLENSDEPSLQPDPILYAAILNFIARSPEQDTVVQAEAVLERMKTRAAQGLCDPPGIDVWTIMMKIYSTVGDSEKSIEILNRIEKPNQYAFQAAFMSCIGSNNPTAVADAWEMFERMVKRYEEGDNECEPTRPFYRSTMTSLDKLFYMRKGNENQEVRENIVSFARRLVRYMRTEHDLNLRGPILKTFLNLCSRISIDPEMFEEVMEVWKISSPKTSSKELGAASDAIMLWMCFQAHWIDQESRNKLVDTVIQVCAESDRVNLRFLLDLQRHDEGRFQDLAKKFPEIEVRGTAEQKNR